MNRVIKVCLDNHVPIGDLQLIIWGYCDLSVVSNVYCTLYSGAQYHNSSFDHVAPMHPENVSNCLALVTQTRPKFNHFLGSIGNVHHCDYYQMFTLYYMDDSESSQTVEIVCLDFKHRALASIKLKPTDDDIVDGCRATTRVCVYGSNIIVLSTMALGPNQTMFRRKIKQVFNCQVYDHATCTYATESLESNGF